MAFNDDSFIREVNEELRSDQMKGAWRRFGRYLIALAVLIVLGTVGYKVYQYWDDNASSSTGDQFLAAMKLADENKNDEALAALDKLEKEGHGAYPVLARMRAATVLAATALLTTSLRNWRDDPALYRPLSLTCVAASILCLGLGTVRPAPLALAVALVVLFSVPWLFAVAHKLIHQDSPDLEPD